MAGDDLGNRMKTYEDVNRHYLIRRMPVIIRVDGKAFHTLTRGMERPWDKIFASHMWNTAYWMCEEIQGAQIGYVQSDEISILLRDYDTLETQGWFDYNIQKMVSISAAFATGFFNHSRQLATPFAPQGFFDARVFNLPKEEVCNYFIWRQQDATRNSIQMLARSLYSHKECHQKNTAALQEMCFQAGKNWNDCETWQKRGVCVVKTEIDFQIPVFTQDRNYIEQFI